VRVWIVPELSRYFLGRGFSSATEQRRFASSFSTIRSLSARQTITLIGTIQHVHKMFSCRTNRWRHSLTAR